MMNDIINWSYIAGLFDGEGSFAIGVAYEHDHSKPSSVKLYAHISGGSLEHLKMVVSFLMKEGLRVSYKNKGIPEKGWTRHKTHDIQIAGFADLKLFVDKISPFLILKVPQCEIIVKAIRLKDECKSNGFGCILDNLDKFDALRRELHTYAVKGPKNLKPWVR